MTSQSREGRSSRRLRISLRALLALVTLCALFFGYAQWRRLRLIQKCQEFYAEGVNISTPEGLLWPAVPAEANLALKQIGEDSFEGRVQTYSTSEASGHFNLLEPRLRKL